MSSSDILAGQQMRKSAKTARKSETKVVVPSAAPAAVIANVRKQIPYLKYNSADSTFSLERSEVDLIPSHKLLNFTDADRELRAVILYMFHGEESINQVRHPNSSTQTTNVLTNGKVRMDGMKLPAERAVALRDWATHNGYITEAQWNQILSACSLDWRGDFEITSNEAYSHSAPAPSVAKKGVVPAMPPPPQSKSYSAAVDTGKASLPEPQIQPSNPVQQLPPIDSLNDYPQLPTENQLNGPINEETESENSDNESSDDDDDTSSLSSAASQESTVKRAPTRDDPVKAYHMLYTQAELEGWKALTVDKAVKNTANGGEARQPPWYGLFTTYTIPHLKEANPNGLAHFTFSAELGNLSISAQEVSPTGPIVLPATVTIDTNILIPIRGKVIGKSAYAQRLEIHNRGLRITYGFGENDYNIACVASRLDQTNAALSIVNELITSRIKSKGNKFKKGDNVKIQIDGASTEYLQYASQDHARDLMTQSISAISEDLTSTKKCCINLHVNAETEKRNAMDELSAKFNAELEDKQKLINTTHQACLDACKRADDTSVELTAANIENKRLREIVDSQTAKIQELEQQPSSLSSEAAEALKDRMESLEKQLANLNIDKENLTRELLKANTILNDKPHEVKTLQSEKSALSMKVEALSAQIKTLNSVKDEKEAANVKLVATIKDLKSQVGLLTGANARIKALEADLAEAKTKALSKTSNSQKDKLLRQAQDDLASFQTQLTESNNELAIAKTYIEEADVANASLQDDRDKKNEEIIQLKHQLETLALQCEESPIIHDIAQQKQVLKAQQAEPAQHPSSLLNTPFVSNPLETRNVEHIESLRANAIDALIRNETYYLNLHAVPVYVGILSIFQHSLKHLDTDHLLSMSNQVDVAWHRMYGFNASADAVYPWSGKAISLSSAREYELRRHQIDRKSAIMANLALI